MRIAGILLIAALAAISGCDSEGRVRPAQTTLRFFHASPNFGTYALLREAKPEAIEEFGGGATVRFDSGPYDFHLQTSPPNSPVVNHETRSVDLSPGVQYFYVAVAPGDQPQLFVAGVPNLPQGFANARYTIVHAHPAQGPLDVYLVAPGTPLASVAPQGSMSFGPAPATFDLTPQTLRLYLTPAGDPNTILFESIDTTASAGSDHYMVVHATGGQTPVDFAVSEVATAALRIPRQGAGAFVRVVQGVDDRLARDVLLDTDTTPLFAAQPFGEISTYAPVAAAQHTLKLTPVGTPGTEESTVEFFALADRYYTIIFAGDTTDGVSPRIMVEDRRPIVGQSTVYIVNAAGVFDFLYTYLLAPGSDITTSFPRSGLAAPDYTSTRIALLPGDYEISVQDGDTLAVVAGPDPLTLVERGVYGVLMLNAADNVTVDLQYFYDTPL